MTKSIIFMFPGQGSQHYQMGKELFHQEPIFRQWMLQLDDFVYSLIGISILKHLYDEKKGIAEPFKRLLYTHPAIFMVEYALAQLLLESGISPDYVIGASLGEFVAAAVAGMLSVEEVLRSLVVQAQLCEAFCPPGEMLAVLYPSTFYHTQRLLYTKSELVAINYDEHFVISGEVAHIHAIQDFLRERGIACEKLPVSYAFHSSKLDVIEPHYKNAFQSHSFSTPEIPFVSSVYGTVVHEQLPHDYFWDVIRKPIQFSQAIQQLGRKQQLIGIDLGPGGTLATFARRSGETGSEYYATLSPFQKDCQTLREVKRACSPTGLLPDKKELRKMTVFLFPGQGSQSKGMGATLFEEFPALTAAADRILGYSIKEICLYDSNHQLNKTQFTQPALYVVNALSYLKKMQENGAAPHYLAGHSLGEYNALFAAGAFDFETGLRLVKKRGELMGMVTNGGMAAVIGLTFEQVQRLLQDAELSNIDIANYNSPSQIVLAGPNEALQTAQPLFERAGVKHYIVLNVSGAFHSRYMVTAQKEFAAFLDGFTFLPLSIPVISNVQARPCRQDEIKSNLIQQIASLVNWNDSIRYLLALGEVEFEVIGPAKVLRDLVDKIRQEAEPLVITTTHQQEKRSETRQESSSAGITATTLGHKQFKKDYNLKYAYVTGSMYRGIASEQLVIRVGKAGMLGFYGTANVSQERIEQAIQRIQKELPNGEPYGMNLLHYPENLVIEEQAVDLYLHYAVRIIEASAYMGITTALVRYRAKGLQRGADGSILSNNRIIAKVSRPEVAEAFLSPAPEYLVQRMVQAQSITPDEAEMLKMLPVADDICVEADSAGHTDQGVLPVLFPAVLNLRDSLTHKYGYKKYIRVGAAGGIGSPEAAAAAFILGADFIVTGSINQCTVEAATSDAVKDLLQQANVQDTDYAPAGDMFEIGARVQVLKKGVFFPGRARRLYELYRQYNSLDEVDEKTRKNIQEKYFQRSFDVIYQEVKAHYPLQEIEKAERSPKYKMALIFKWYFAYSTRLALSGDLEHKVDYQIHCGPALGAFNQWVKGSSLEDWRNRHSDEIGEKLLKETAKLLNQRFQSLLGNS